jgi:hypothetical protein
VLLLAALPACGEGESHWQMRSAAQWGALLWDRDPQLVTTAETALKELRRHDPQGVLAALEAAMKTRPPKPTATPFSLAPDAEAAKRLGLAPTAPAEAAQLDLAAVRARLQEMGLGPSTIRGTTEVDVVMKVPLERADLLRLQARLATRGALDVRALAFDPARPPRGDEEAQAARVLATEAARVVQAREAKSAYVPADASYRAVPRSGTAGAAPGDFLLVAEPASADDAIDERWVATAKPGRSPTGAPAVVVTWQEEARARIERFAKERAGRRYVAVLDGVAAAAPETPVPGAASWTIPVAETDSPEAREAAATLAVAWPTGRLPFPLTPVPPPAEYGADPPPDNQVARVTSTFGKFADPMLVRLAKEAPEAWTRAAAAWAHAEVERGVGEREGEGEEK